MEDKLVITTPAAYYTGGVSQAIDKTNGAAFGYGVCGGPAFQFNLIQFMLGAPIVDYDSVAVTTSDSPPGQIALIDTSRQEANDSQFNAVTSASAYGTYISGQQSGAGTGNASTASGTYTVTFTGTGTTYTIQGPAAATIWAANRLPRSRSPASRSPPGSARSPTRSSSRAARRRRTTSRCAARPRIAGT